jgi:hypothetical protein
MRTQGLALVLADLAGFEGRRGTPGTALPEAERAEFHDAHELVLISEEGASTLTLLPMLRAEHYRHECNTKHLIRVQLPCSSEYFFEQLERAFDYSW